MISTSVSWKQIRFPAILILILSSFYLGWFYHIEPFWVAIVRNRFSGQVEIDSVPGFKIRAPWVSAAQIDTRPIRVCVTSAGRVSNCKLVQFNVSGWQEFVKIEGFHYYWWSNRVSFNGGYSDENRGMKDLLRGYAFGSQTYPFVTVLRHY